MTDAVLGFGNFLFGNDVFNAQEARRHDQAALAENSARPALCFNNFDTTGTGQIVSPTPVLFDVTFTARPVLVTGLTLLTSAGPNWTYPLATVGVFRWHTDERGYYLGAYIYVNVKVEPVAASTKVVTGEQRQLDETVANIERYIGVLERKLAAMRAKRVNWGTQITDAETEIARARAQLAAAQASQARARTVSGTTYVGPEEAKVLASQRDYYKALLSALVARNAQESLEYVAAQGRLAEINAQLAAGANYREPKPTMTHHLMFYGPAMKDLSENITAKLAGPISPNIPGGAHA